MWECWWTALAFATINSAWFELGYSRQVSSIDMDSSKCNCCWLPGKHPLWTRQIVFVVIFYLTVSGSWCSMICSDMAIRGNHGDSSIHQIHPRWRRRTTLVTCNIMFQPQMAVENKQIIDYTFEFSVNWAVTLYGLYSGGFFCLFFFFVVW